MRELHGRARTGLELLFHRPLILPEDLGTPPRFDFARAHIQQEIDFPGVERVQDLSGQAYFFGMIFASSSYWSLAIRFTPAAISAFQRSIAASWLPKL